jgi:hypothetical protein
MLLALGLMAVCICPQDSAKARTAPPVSLAPPKASPPRAGTKNSATTPDRAPAASGLPQLPNPAPAADYDGFSVGTGEDNDAPDQAPPPVRSRAARGAKPDLDANGIDREDEALKRKLTICKSCK